MRAKVSVILPSLNVAGYIRECLDSVVKQSLQELEIICVDAGSADGTEEILKEYAEADSRIVLLHSGMKSYGRQVNMGLEYASGEYVAILETDDWAAEEMYQYLYDRAVLDKLDYAAADFDTFIRLQSGYYYATRQRLFSDAGQDSFLDAGRDSFPDAGQEPERPAGDGISPVPARDWYGRVLGTDQIALLRSTDYVLWKGIYNREFLNANRIWLHESPGAAFQDMGFLQQVKTYAKRAEYIDKSFYRYRQGREDASSGCLEGLRYYEGEFRWLDEQQGLLRHLKGNHRRYYYFTMSISFITKYEQILSGLHGEWRDERLERPYGWFAGQISQAINRGLLDETMYGEELWERLTLLLASREEHARKITERDKGKEKTVQEFLRVTENRPVVIFGCGIRGERLMLFCDRNGVRIDAFCDNNEALQETKKFGFPIISPLKLVGQMSGKDEVVLLSMKAGVDQVREQLIRLGAEGRRVIDRLPGGIL